ncbi:MAG: hypothetical protein IMZ69_10170 [Spirochaetes bacterium]|nr:hypothetical protein [Spirochaetota bacterium]
MPVQSGARTHYSPRGLDPLRRLFCQRFPAFRAAYEKRYAAFFGSFRLPLIARAASAFRLCGDWSQGIARIKCTNPDCKSEYWRPFSCKVFHSASFNGWGFAHELWPRPWLAPQLRRFADRVHEAGRRGCPRDAARVVPYQTVFTP